MSRPPRIARLSLTTAAPGKLAAFYGDALGFERTGAEERGGPELARLMGIADARAQAVLLRLGRQAVELVAFAPPGRPYPPDCASNDPWFQHMAIVVADMKAAFARLSQSHGWTPITRPEPQSLPARSGGVVAFKFRDPEGHPLELIEFPPGAVPPAWQGADRAGPCLGIDHSAIAVAESGRSIAFYEQLLGFAPGPRTLNRGPAQDRLDGLQGAVVEVTALDARAAEPPHLELLCYRAPAPRPAMRWESNDVAATRLVLEVEDLPMQVKRLAAAQVGLALGGAAAALRDPDGHALCLTE